MRNIFGLLLVIQQLIHILEKDHLLLWVLLLFIKELIFGAPQGASLVAITSGKITYTGFLGGGGYTITLSSGNLKITYCHVSPTFIVKVGDIVEKGDIIGYVGPKNVYGVKGNQYKDSNRKSNKWCYNRTTFTSWN